MNYAQIEKELAALGEKAMDNKLAVEDMKKGTFTISSGGFFGSVFGTPIMNSYQSVILGMHGIFDIPVIINGKKQPNGAARQSESSNCFKRRATQATLLLLGICTEKDCMMEGSSVCNDIIIEVLKRRGILLDLNEARNPEANRRKSKAWKEIQDLVLVHCKRVFTIEQVKRIWRNRKAHVREAILKEKRYRSSTGGGLDPVLEKTISTTLSSLSQAETLLARTLGREAVMAGLGNMETYVDKV
ncbi:unnamed protein product [Cylicocyclus nassatus]|uniref:Dihydrolipoyllysine-residue succinyltransferase component of 2-oxoglutarate dehydrogenase complex, mitochondrial n=1 Tax=Cylicocyclus nassatus TaxID=53992 RepID=A0AA36GT40_CYLNA|nr:unnamed protein product [Cylicocyclus nassatus]